MSSFISTSRLIGNGPFKEIVKMSNKIIYSEQIKITMNRILKNLDKISDYISYLPDPNSEEPIEIYRYLYSIHLISIILHTRYEDRVDNSKIKFQVILSKEPNYPKILNLLIHLTIQDEDKERLTYKYDYTDINVTSDIIIEWIKIHLFDFLYKYRNLKEFNSNFFTILSKN